MILNKEELGNLSGLISQRGIKEIFHFHTDHWEPWTGEDHTMANVGHIEEFIKHHERFDHSRKMTLNYKIGFPKYTALDENALSRSRIRFVEGDYIGFLVPDEGENEDSRMKIIRTLEEDTGHELQIHIHHERITSGDYCIYSSPTEIPSEKIAEMDEMRLDFFVKLLLEQFEKETGRKAEHWTFVHGLWALNASDTKVCNVYNEIELLMNNGCIADFSMPSGRWIVDSDIREPFTCLPVSTPKGYDFVESERTRIKETPKPSNRRRFLIWNQEIPYLYCSLDYTTQGVIDALSDTYDYLETWLRTGFCVDGKLFIKTHAHSMNKNFDPRDGYHFPMCHPDVIRAFGALQEVCDESDTEMNYYTADEVISELCKVDNNLESNLTKGDIIRNTISSNRHSHRDLIPNIESGFKSLIDSSAKSFDFSSLGSYYGVRKERGAMLSSTDIEISKYISQKFTPEDYRIFELGPGIGNLSVILANMGFECLTVEGYNPRHAFSKMVENSLVSEGAGTLDSHFGVFPSKDPRKLGSSDQDIEALKVTELKEICKIRGLPVSGKKSELIDRIKSTESAKKQTIFISTNIVSALTANNHEEIISKMVEHNNLLVDLGSFGTMREGRERQALLSEFEKFGYSLNSIVIGGDLHLRDRTMVVHLSR